MSDYYKDLRLLGIPETKRKQLAKKGIHDITELLAFYPRGYHDYGIPGPPREGKAAIVFDLKYINTRVSSSGMDLLCANGSCDEKKISVVWFRQNYRYDEIYSMRGQKVLVAGDFTYDPEWNQYSGSSPDLFVLYNGQKNPIIYPVYSKILGMADTYLCDTIGKALDGFLNCIVQEMPVIIERNLKLMPMLDAVRQIHLPENMNLLREAQKRVRSEKLFSFAVRMSSGKKKKTSSYRAKTNRLQKSIIAALPYALTVDQESAVKSFSEQIKSGKSVHALIQGDVGCGKSIVAFLMMALIAENGFQSVLMAPTSVLALQHFEEMNSLFTSYGIRVEYVPPLTSLKKKEKDAILERIASGESRLIVGTHSLLSDAITYQDLGLIITDEEHKFGVEQREKLLQKTSDGVHYITMSATPIPRSLAGVVYGDETELCLIRTMPKGRKPIQTAVTSSYPVCFRFLKKQIDAGGQVYVVCPQVEDRAQNEEIASVETLQKRYAELFGDNSVASLTGRNTKKEMEVILNAFKENQVQILIATTVIEVGVNCPNANTIVVHNAERFGLASLHQLRGRVGRGGGDAYCILFSNEKENPRLQAMCRTTDGFEIAEEDMRLRGAGNLFGTQQSGMNEYIGLILSYPEEYQEIKKAVKKLLN